MMKLRHSQRGFTIIELMISTAVFATILLVLSVGLLQIGRSYYKGVTTTRTQEASREIIDEVAQAIQFGGGGVFNNLANNGPSDGICVGGKRFSFVLDRQLVDIVTNPPEQSRNVLVVDNVGSGACSGGMQAVNVTNNPLVDPGGGTLQDTKELLNTRMRLARLQVQQVGGATSDLYRVTVRVVSGDTNLLNAAHDACETTRAGTQFCAWSELSTVVQKRVR